MKKQHFLKQKTHILNSRRFISLLMGWAFLLLTNLGHASTNLITNGGFELGVTVPPGTRITLGAGSTSVTGWAVSRDNIDYIDNLFWSASEGGRSLDLNGEAASGAISQTFSTTPGLSYAVLFDLAGNPDDASKLKKLRVTAASQSQDFLFDATGRTRTDMGWIKQAFVFTATAAQTILGFESLIAGSFGPALDNVQVVPAATFKVTKTNDTNDGSCDPADCSLREAIGAAVSDGYSVITFAPNLAGQTIALTIDELLINKNLTINGLGATLLSVKGGDRVFPPSPIPSGFRVFHISAGAVVAISGLTIKEGGAFTGGGIWNEGVLTLISSTIRNNSVRGSISSVDGGISNDGALTLVYSTVTANHAFTECGGIGNDGSMVIQNSTISDNNTSDDPFGGGICNNGTATITNSTISGNFAGRGDLGFPWHTTPFNHVGGGGILNNGDVTLINSTISGNRSSRYNGGGIANYGSVSLRNTIVANNQLVNTASGGGGPAVPSDCAGTVTSQGHNIIGDITGCTILGDPVVVTDPMLDSFLDPGSPGQGRYPLKPGSPAIDVSLDTCLIDVSSDQLRMVRPVDGTRGDGLHLRCDLGAIEFVPIVNDLIAGAPQLTNIVYDPTPAPGAPAGTYRFTATFRTKPRTDPFSYLQINHPLVEVVTLQLARQGAAAQDQPVLLNADGDPGRVGARIKHISSIHAGATDTFDFVIGLQKREPFLFFVDFRGEEQPPMSFP